MKILLALIVACICFGCATKMPEKPAYKTHFGEECAADCEKDYSDCLASEIRPDFLVFSPRKKACEKLIRGCYQLCTEKEQKRPSASSQ